jgi:hypothetical protein
VAVPGGLRLAPLALPAGWSYDLHETRALAAGTVHRVLLALYAPAGTSGADGAAGVSAEVRAGVRGRLKDSAVLRRYGWLKGEAEVARGRVQALEKTAAAVAADRARLLADEEQGITLALADAARREAAVSQELAEAGGVLNTLNKQLAEAGRRAAGLVAEALRAENLRATRASRARWDALLQGPAGAEVAALAGELVRLAQVLAAGAYDQLGAPAGELVDLLAREAAEAS